MEVIANITDFFVKLSILFIGLLIASYYLYRKFFKDCVPDMQSQVVLMTGALFLLSCLPQLQLPYLSLTILSLELCIIWVYCLVLYAARIEETPGILLKESEQIYLSCFVISTSLLATLLDQLQPLLHGAILLLFFVAVVAWGVKFLQILTGFYRSYRYKGSRATTSLALFAIATIVLSILIYEVFVDLLAPDYYVLFAGFATIIYLVATWQIVKRIWKHYQKSLMMPHHHDVLSYSYLALLGYYLIETSFVAEFFLTIIWWLCIVVLLTLETGRFYYAIKQKHHKGLIQARLLYHRDNWLHLFSLFSVYWFTINYFYQYAPDSKVAYFIVLLGPYILLTYLVYQLAAQIKTALSQH